jgi:hypothetical protein
MTQIFLSGRLQLSVYSLLVTLSSAYGYITTILAVPS